MLKTVYSETTNMAVKCYNQQHLGVFVIPRITEILSRIYHIVSMRDTYGVIIY